MSTSHTALGASAERSQFLYLASKLALSATAVFGFYVFLRQLGAPTAHEIETLRRQFRLPPDVPLAAVRVNRESRLVSSSRIEGVAKLSEPQFRSYVAGLGKAFVWKPLPIDLDGRVFFGAYDSSAFDWELLDRRSWKGWGGLSSQAVESIRSGYQLCFEVSANGERGAMGGRRCSPPPGPTAPAVFVQGLLDDQTRTLHMQVWGNWTK